MTDAREVIRRREPAQGRGCRAEYARLPPVQTPTQTPGCTYYWMEDGILCVAEPIPVHVPLQGRRPRPRGAGHGSVTALSEPLTPVSLTGAHRVESSRAEEKRKTADQPAQVSDHRSG